MSAHVNMSRQRHHAWLRVDMLIPIPYIGSIHHLFKPASTYCMAMEVFQERFSPIEYAFGVCNETL